MFQTIGSENGRETSLKVLWGVGAKFIVACPGSPGRRYRHVWLSFCQRRSKFSPLGRSKSGPPWLKPGEIYPVVPVVHRRDPRCFV